MNPALQSFWTHYFPSGTSRFQVVGVWSSGVGESYRVTAYELKYDHAEEVAIFSVKKMNQLIELKIIKLL